MLTPLDDKPAERIREVASRVIAIRQERFLDEGPPLSEAERAALMEHACINGHVWHIAGVVTKAGLTSRDDAAQIPEGEVVELLFSEEHCAGCKLKRWTHLPDT